MKVVLFCGGMGMRLRDYSSTDPQATRRGRAAPDAVALDEVLRPLRAQGLHPLPRSRRATDQGVLPQLQRVLRRTTSCSPRAVSKIELLSTDIDDWTITFVDTGADVEHRRTAAPGPGPRRRRRDVPRQLRRRALRPRSRRVRRRLRASATRPPASSASRRRTRSTSCTPTTTTTSTDLEHVGSRRCGSTPGSSCSAGRSSTSSTPARSWCSSRSTG